MSATCPSDDLKEKVGDVPIFTHTRVLGVDIGVNQLQQRCEMSNVRYPLAAGGETVEINAVGSDSRVSGPDRKLIAAWARRNLFNQQ